MSDDLMWCPDCEQRVEEPVKAYECPECGNRFPDEGEGSRCQDCNKFSSKVSDEACNDCGGDLERYRLVEASA